MRIRTYGNVTPDFTNLASTMNEMFKRSAAPYNYAQNGGSNGEAAERVARLPIDVVSHDDGFQILAYLPGVDSEAVEITFEGDELTIRGSYQPVNEEAHYVRRELFHAKFERTVTFNTPVDVDDIVAEFDNGVLTLSVPKAEEVRPKQIKVQSK